MRTVSPVSSAASSRPTTPQPQTSRPTSTVLPEGDILERAMSRCSVASNRSAASATPAPIPAVAPTWAAFLQSSPARSKLLAMSRNEQDEALRVLERFAPETEAAAEAFNIVWSRGKRTEWQESRLEQVRIWCAALRRAEYSDDPMRRRVGFKLAESAEDTLLRYAAVQSLCDGRDTRKGDLADIEAATKDPSPVVRLEALTALLDCSGDNATGDIVGRLLLDPSPTIRAQGLAFLEDSDEFEAPRGALVNALRVESDRGLQAMFILHMLKSEDHWMGSHARKYAVTFGLGDIESVGFEDRLKLLSTDAQARLVPRERFDVASSDPDSMVRLAQGSRRDD